MKHVLKVPRRLNAPSEAFTSSPIWISDAVLNETFERFSRGCRRHGSHVPGPLESRKRAARRKNTSIAYAGASAAPLDGLGLFGPGSQGGWWKQEPPHRHARGLPIELPKARGTEHTQKPSQAETTQSLLSSWFREPPPPPMPQTNGDQSHEHGESPLLSDIEVAAGKNVFGQGLTKAHSLAEVRALVQELELDFPQKRAFTDLACKRVLELALGPEALMEYILDSTLSHPGSQTLDLLTTMLTGKWLAEKARSEVIETICQCISLGVATTKDIKYFITNVPRFQMPANLELLRKNDPIHDLYDRILSVIEESKVISISDLGKPFLGTWFRATSPAATLLLWKLGCALEKPQKNLATKILTKSISYDPGRDQNKARNISLLRFLEEVPASLLPHALVQTTHNLLQMSTQNGKEHHTSILCWHDFLVNINRKTVLRAFTQVPPSIWEEAISHPSTRDERAKRAVIACWVIARMSTDHRTTTQDLRKLGLRKIFRDIYSNHDGHGSRDVLAQVLVTVQSLSLPYTISLLENLRFITNEYLVFRKGEFAQRVAEQNLAQHFSVLEHDADYDRFRNHFNDALVELAESVNKNLPQFLNIARAFVEKDDVAFLIVSRILKHNLAFHNALSRASPQHTRQGRTENPEARDSQPGVEPRQALEFMHHLAVFLATSPVLRPRQILRRVYWCFTMIRRYGGPIETPIVRALWHAGVTRYRTAGRGAATTILKWIVNQVRIVEGDRVADMLIRSGGFRKKIEQQFEDLEWRHGNMLPAKVDGLWWLDPNRTPVRFDGLDGRSNTQQDTLEHKETRKIFPTSDPVEVQARSRTKFSKERLLHRANFNKEAMKIRLLDKQIKSLDHRLRQIA